MKPILFILFLFPVIVQSQELEIYDISSFRKSTAEEVSFTSLTDRYAFNDHSDSSVIREEYLGDTKIENDNYHVLSATYRARFFKHVGIAEKEKIFIYNFSLDTIITHRVKDIPLIAVLSPYFDGAPIRQYYYMIGFEFDKIGIEHLGDYYSNTLIHVGKENPFQTGNIQSIPWEQVDSLTFPANIDEIENAEWLKGYSRGKTFRFSTGSLDYFIQNMTNGVSGARHLVVIESHTGTTVFNRMYYDSEGSSLVPLTTANKEYVQWTGKIFKKKPPIVFGFLYHSFRCPRIEFIGQTEPPIEIRCDNRH